MQNPQDIPETDPLTDTQSTPRSQRPDMHLVGNDAAPRSDASTGPLLPASPSSSGDPNHHAARRVFGTSLGMFLPALILLVVGIAVIVWIAW